MKNIGEYDKIDAFLALIKILEIKGGNKLIGDLQESVIRQFKAEHGDSGLLIDWVIDMVLEAREDAINEFKKNINN